MQNIPADDPLAVAIVTAIQQGDAASLARQLEQHPYLATSRIVDSRGTSRTLLHVVADWPGHVPNGAQMVATLAAAGADMSAPAMHTCPESTPETPLHWAASSDDVRVLDALLDHGADIEAPGAIFTGGTAMSDAVVFAQWLAARRLLERGAMTTLWQAAALGLLERVQQFCTATPAPDDTEITNALWHACRGGQLEVSDYLVTRGASLNWVGWNHKTPLDAAVDSGSKELVTWLRAHGATANHGRA